ncbi:MAG: insulinase family protein [Nitrospirae bacterium]|nr:insulinase family protein [Nitrospirota bacterium]
MKDISFKKVHLDNGIRVVAERIPSVKSVSLGIWVNVGSRDESEKEGGISHFIEHMFFKGTRRRSAHDIALEIDSIGGELNAFTTRETTTFYVKILDEHLSRGIDIISDIFLHSSLAKKEIEKEKQVILEEIKMVEDDPEDYIHDMHSFMVWDKNPLARPILGNTDTVQDMKREAMLRYMECHYHPDNIVISAAGNFDFSLLIGQLNKNLGKFSRDKFINERTMPTLKGGVWTRKKGIEQIHFCLGTMGLPQRHENRYAFYALNAIMGSSMSSRLFQEVREKRGLVYTIYSYISSFTDVGLLNIYAGTSKEALPKVLELVIREIRKIKRDGISRREMSRVKNQMKGSLMLGLESTSNRMSRLARDEMYLSRYFSPEEIIDEIEKITPSQIRDLTDGLFKTPYLSLAVLGPVSKEMIPEKLMQV